MWYSSIISEIDITSCNDSRPSLTIETRVSVADLFFSSSCICNSILALFSLSEVIKESKREDSMSPRLELSAAVINCPMLFSLTIPVPSSNRALLV